MHQPLDDLTRALRIRELLTKAGLRVGGGELDGDGDAEPPLLAAGGEDLDDDEHDNAEERGDS